MRTNHLLWNLMIALGALAAAGCGDDNGGQLGTGGGATDGLQEIWDQGLTRYVDEFDPTEADPTPTDGVQSFEFDTDPESDTRGPICLRGAQYQVDVRDGSSDELFIYLQGGGACWDDFCAAFETVRPLAEASGGVLDPELADNPLADADVVYLPYCDGSLFAGDVDRVLPSSLVEGEPSGPPVLSYQRGLQNLTAALDVAVEQFPNPSRVVLGGVSGGGFGTIVSAPLVRYYYPDVDILVLNDSGIGVADSEDTGFVDDLLEGWNAQSLIPESCDDCTGNGHVTRLIEWNLDQDPGLSISGMSHAEDSTIASFFLMIGGEQFKTSLLSETERMADNYPDRYKRFIMAGTAHTAILNPGEPVDVGIAQLGSLRTEIGGQSLMEWITAMLEGDAAWDNQVAESIE